MLELPGMMPCPACDVPLKRVLIAPVIDSSGKLEAVSAVCPRCATPYQIGVDEIARAAARAVLVGL